VAHFHYVLFGGALQGFFAGMYYWWPKAFGHMLDERLGRINWFLMFVGFNLTFFPMHFAGLLGQPRRTWQYSGELGVGWMNMMSTIGAFTIGLGFFLFAVNVWRSRKSPPAPPDPWDARTLEWAIPSPAPEHNFDHVPVVESLDDFWHKKYTTDEHHQLVKVADGNDIAQKGDRGDEVHLPSPSYWPIVLAAGLPIFAFGIIYNLWLSVVGAIVILAAIYGWATEPTTDPNAAHGDGHGHPDDGHGHDGDGHGDGASVDAEVEEAPVG
jgi:cytochrome c oxidase subunit 1